MDVLKKQLEQAKQQRKEASSQIFLNLMAELDKAVQSPDAALDLYQRSGGEMPDPAPVITRYTDETTSEKEQRLAVDEANKASLAYAVQLHCGLMRFGALFVENPQKQGLQDDWIAWLKSSARLYPQVNKAVEDSRQQKGSDDDTVGKGKGKGVNNGGGGRRGGGKRNGGQDKASSMRDQALRDSIITSFLNFHAWGDKEQGGWRVHDLPKLYRSAILDPLRENPSAATLAAWDTFIAMKNADSNDPDKWAQVDYPALQFERAMDDFAINSGADKAAVLTAIITSNPNHPKTDEWIARVEKILDSGSKPEVAVTPEPGGPGVVVTTQQQGDATIITTTTNTAPVAPPPTPPKP